MGAGAQARQWGRGKGGSRTAPTGMTGGSDGDEEWVPASARTTGGGELVGQSNLTGDHKGRPYGGRLGWREEEGIKTARFFAEHRNDMWGRARGVGGEGGSRTAPTGMTEGMGEGWMGPRIREDNGRGG